jgi:hypothetical protein
MSRHIVLDDGPLALTVLRLIETSPIEDKITVERRTSHLTGGKVVSLEDRTGYVWSTGENMLWDFIASLAGQEKINLGETAAHFRPTDLAEWMAACLAELFGTAPE